MVLGAGGRPVAVLIPVCDPTERLVRLVEDLAGRFGRIVLVDDGSASGREYLRAAEPLVEKIIVHERNVGKGAALKTGLAYIGESADVVTADADGQHAPDDVERVGKALATHRGGLVLGVRAFDGKVPLRSRFGNFWTRIWFWFATGLWVGDTQTGLRGIPSGLVRRIASLPGERFEFEMSMLAYARLHAERPLEVPIRTIYIPGNVSHHRPLADTRLIYRALARALAERLFRRAEPWFVRVVLSLGSNVEPRREYLAKALDAVRGFPSTRFVAASPVEETEPVGVPEEFRGLKFLNQVVIVDTALGARDFSDRMHRVEADLGRVRGVRNGPRTIDIDMVDYGGMTSDDPELTLPHPRAGERDFVMRPWRELERRMASGGASSVGI